MFAAASRNQSPEKKSIIPKRFWSIVKTLDFGLETIWTRVRGRYVLTVKTSHLGCFEVLAALGGTICLLTVNSWDLSDQAGSLAVLLRLYHIAVSFSTQKKNTTMIIWPLLSWVVALLQSKKRNKQTKNKQREEKKQKRTKNKHTQQTNNPMQPINIWPSSQTSARQSWSLDPPYNCPHSCH